MIWNAVITKARLLRAAHLCIPVIALASMAVLPALLCTKEELRRLTQASALREFGSRASAGRQFCRRNLEKIAIAEARAFDGYDTGIGKGGRCRL